MGNEIDDRFPELPANAYTHAVPVPLHDTKADRSDQVPSGYKRTEVGVIPSNWDVELLGNLFVFKNGLNKAKQFFGTGTPIVNYMDVFKNPGLRMDDLSGRVKLSPEEIRNFEVRLGDVFFTRTSETVEEIGVASVMLEEPCDTVFSGFVLRARPRDDRLEDHYKQYCFSSRVIRSQIVSNATYTTRALTNGRSLSAVRVTVPPKPEQRAIAKALSDVDRLYTALEVLISKKRAIKQAVTQQLLTGKIRLPGFHEAWETQRLGDMGSCLRGVSYNPTADLVGHDKATTVRLLRANNIQDTTVTTSDIHFVESRKVSDSQVLRPNDILVCMANGSKELVGKAGLFRISDGFAYTFGAFMGCFRTKPKFVDPSFVYYLFQSDRFRRFVGLILAGSSINNFKPSDIESAEFQIPSRIEQTGIANVLSDIEAEIAALDQLRDKVRTVKQGMVQQLLTGGVSLVYPKVSSN